jgi:hypothetical protein
MGINKVMTWGIMSVNEDMKFLNRMGAVEGTILHYYCVHCC